MCCIADMVREANALFFAPDFEFGRDPALIVDEPPLRDKHMLEDGVTWVRVYLDGSALDYTGTVRPYAPLAAVSLRGTTSLALAA